METTNDTVAFLDRLAKGLAAFFGPQCETIVQEFHEDSVLNLSIYNGHVSGREAGSTRGIFDDSVDHHSLHITTDEDVNNQAVQLRGGRSIKSATFFITADGVCYGLGINYDTTITKKVESLLSQFNTAEGKLFDSLQKPVDPKNSSVENLFDNAMSQVGKPVGAMKKADRILLVRILKDTPFFDLQKSVPYLAEHLQVTKFTIYKYLNELSEVKE